MKNLKAAIKQLQEEKPGLWANIRAKRARGEKPAHKNSNAHKDAVKAGKKINKMSEANINPEAEKLVGAFIMKLAKRYGYGAKDAIYLIQDVIKNIEASGKLNEEEGKSLQDLQMGEKFTFNGKEYTFIELYPELENAARVVLPDGRKTVVSFGGGKVNTGKKAGIGPDAFGQGKGHHID